MGLRSALSVFVSAAIAVGVVAVVVTRDNTINGRPQAAGAISVKANEIRTVPDVSQKRRDVAARELARTLRTIYETAFIKSAATETPSASPTPSPARRLKRLMTAPAVAALKASPGVFDIGHALVLTSGSVNYDGLITFGTQHPIEALLDVEFLGHAIAPANGRRVLTVHQIGTLTLKRTSGRWLVDGFDLRFATHPLPLVSPAPS